MIDLETLVAPLTTEACDYDVSFALLPSGHKRWRLAPNEHIRNQTSICPRMRSRWTWGPAAGDLVGTEEWVRLAAAVVAASGHRPVAD